VFELLQSDGLKIAHSQDTRVDDNDVETTKLGYRLGDGVADRRWVCTIRPDCEVGATAIEYGLIAAGISVAVITVVNTLGSQLKSAFTTVTADLQSAGNTARRFR
jgi:pilus assembly protein Flp/PilA